MKKNRAKAQEYNSMKEYEKKFYPITFKNKLLKMTDPNTLGIALARESLSKFKQLMQKQKVCV